MQSAVAEQGGACRWRKGTLGLPISVSHDGIAKAMRRLVSGLEVQYDAGYGLPLVDIAVEAEDGSKLAIMVRSPPTVCRLESCS